MPCWNGRHLFTEVGCGSAKLDHTFWHQVVGWMDAGLGTGLTVEAYCPMPDLRSPADLFIGEKLNAEFCMMQDGIRRFWISAHV